MELTFVTQIREAQKKRIAIERGKMREIGKAIGRAEGRLEYIRGELRFFLEEFYGDGAKELVVKTLMSVDFTALRQLYRFLVFKRPTREEFERKAAELLPMPNVVKPLE